MTLHTRVMVTTPGVDARAAFDRMRELIGATDRYTWWESPDPSSENTYRQTMRPGFHMDLGQGLVALMWVDHDNGVLMPGGHDDDCEKDCAGYYDNPAGYIEINYDTAYGYRAANNASCGDLHAWLTREIGAWLAAQGAAWQWYDESGDGWLPSEQLPGTLGDAELGDPTSTRDQLGEDPRRAFATLLFPRPAVSTPNQASGLSGLHDEPHPRAGETMRVRWALVPPGLNEEAPFRLEDWWDRVSGQQWGMSQGNPAAIVYGFRSGLGGLPYDDEVVYGKVGRFGYLVHASELRETVETGS